MIDNKGYVYVLYNPIYEKYGEIYKIGQAKDIKDRLKSYSTYYPEESEIKYSIMHPYYKEIEKVVHLRLKEYRINTNREFFKCSLDTIKDTIDDIKGYTLEEISIFLNKEVDTILSRYKKEDITEPINLRKENISKIFKENDKELYSLFFSKETGSIKSIVKIFIDKLCTNKDGKLLISCIDKATHKYKYVDMYNNSIVITSSSLWSLINSSCDIKNLLGRIIYEESYKQSLEDFDSKTLQEYRKYMSKEFMHASTKFKHILLEYF